jgi:hypothetical protein
MNPFEIFNKEEIERVSDAVGTLENRNYTKEEWNFIENRVLDNIMSNSFKNGDIDRARDDFYSTLDKIETCIGKV